MSVLLGYTHPTGVYSRQRGKNAIPTILIGGTHRVYAETVVKTLEKHAEKHPQDAEMILGMYRHMKKQHEQEQNDA